MSADTHGNSSDDEDVVEEMCKDGLYKGVRIEGRTFRRHCCVGLLHAKFGEDAMIHGTAQIVKINNSGREEDMFILTAAHNVFNRKAKLDAKEVVFQLGAHVDGQASMEKGLKIAEFMVPDEYRNSTPSKKAAMDIAKLVIPPELLDQIRKEKIEPLVLDATDTMNVLKTRQLYGGRGTKVDVGGYPKDPDQTITLETMPSERIFHSQLWEHSGYVKMYWKCDVTPCFQDEPFDDGPMMLVFEDLCTCTGHSGAAVVVDDTIVIGIHSSSNKVKETVRNYSAAITAHAIKWLMSQRDSGFTALRKILHPNGNLYLARLADKYGIGTADLMGEDECVKRIIIQRIMDFVKEQEAEIQANFRAGLSRERIIEILPGDEHDADPVRNHLVQLVAAPKADAGAKKAAKEENVEAEKKVVQDIPEAKAKALQEKAEAEKKALREEAEAEKKALREKAEAEKKALREKAEAEKKALREEAEAEKKALREKAEAEKKALREEAEAEKKALLKLSAVDKIVKAGFTETQASEAYKESAFDGEAGLELLKARRKVGESCIVSTFWRVLGQGLESKTEIDLRSSGIDAEKAKAIAAALPTCRSLQRLNLYNNTIGDEGAKAIAAALPSCRSLARLELAKNEIGEDGAKAIAAALPSCTSLVELNLYKNQIGDEGAKAIAAALPSCTSLQKFSLGDNSIGDEGAQAIAAALPSCTSLRELGLWGNSIGDEGAKAIAAALPSCTSLQELWLSSNSIGDEGAKAIAAALPTCRSLQILKLFSNTIGDEGAKAIAAAIPTCTSLQQINLATNRIGDDGAKAIAAALPMCGSLQDLRLQTNNIGDEGAKAIAATLPQCKSLTRLFLKHNQISDAGKTAIREAWTKAGKPDHDGDGNSMPLF